MISGLLHSKASETTWHTEHAGRLAQSPVDHAVIYLDRMMKDGVRPNAVTVSVLVDAFGRHNPPRISEAKSLVEQLVNQTIISANNNKVMSALITVCGQDGDIQGALDAFQQLKRPDLIAINSFLTACARCGKDKMALRTFQHYFNTNKSNSGLQPDLISFSVILASQLQKCSTEGMYQASKFYNWMRQLDVSPDKPLVDL
uniref:Pentacotripeptide-repeat region of PRORP domain-containing protein n=1 Tax=Craspedostauros australis TaxID=1486917 RepID=A0A7R9WMG1_9STRA